MRPAEDERRTLVIADDEPGVLQLVCDAVSIGDRYRIVAASDGDEAWEAIRRHRPEAVILDIEMPGRTGLELAIAIKADATLAGTRVILLTSRAKESDVAAGLAAGADFYLTKPFSIADLLETVAQASAGT